jgi:hypothetical protein
MNEFCYNIRDVSYNSPWSWANTEPLGHERHICILTINNSGSRSTFEPKIVSKIYGKGLKALVL